MPIRFACPRCGAAQAVSSKYGGTVMNCTSCKQPVQVPPAPPKPAGQARKSGGSSRPAPVMRPARESRSAFWALCRLSVWGIALSGVAISVIYYFAESANVTKTDEKNLLALTTLVFLFASYFLARTFDDSTKSFQELMISLRRKKK